MIKHLLRKPLPQEVVALLEKIDSIDDTTDSSYYRARCLVEEGEFTRYERLLLRRALRAIPRRVTLHHAMSVVINEPQETEATTTYKDNGYWGPSVLSTVQPQTLTGRLRQYLNNKLSHVEHVQEHLRVMRELERTKMEQELRIKEMEAERAKLEMTMKYSPKITKQAEQRAYYTIQELNRKFAKE